MKKYIAIIIAFVFITACDIDLKPESSLTYNGFWDTEEAARAAHAGIYAKYRDYASTLWSMGEVRSDIWGGPTVESPASSDLIDNNISSSVVHFGNWANFYGLMHYINDFLKNAPSVTFKNEADRQLMLAQVYGIRAQIYYTMVKAWGDVPISLEPLLKVNLEELKKPRSPKADVMAQIKSDIAKSLELFGNTNALWAGKNVYWSKGATLVLKGDVYLWSGQVLGGGQADFAEAKKALTEVQGFELVAYDKLWGERNEFNKEFIFAFDYQQDQASNYFASFTGRAVDFKGLYNEDGESLAKFVVNGASRYGPVEKTLKMLSDVEDKRSDTFIRLYQDDSGYVPFTTIGKSYSGAVLNKFLGSIGEDGSRKQYNNVPLYRYADVVLMLAEAKNQLGEDPTAEINKIRERAYGDKYDASKHAYTNASKLENKKAILDERFKEFVGEGKRWWDLVRAGDGIVFEEIAKLDASEAYKIYYSISQTMLANDDQLKQTEGYK